MIETLKQTIPAGGSVQLSSGLRSFYVKAAVFPLDLTLTAQHGSKKGTALGIEQGFFYYGVDGGPVSLTVKSASQQTVEIIVSDGQIGMNQIDVTSLTVPTERPLTNATLADVPCPAGVKTPVYAGHADTYEVLIENLGDEVLRIGDVNTGATRGKPLNPYSEAVVKGAGALYVWNTGVTAVAVAMTLVQK